MIETHELIKIFSLAALAFTVSVLSTPILTHFLYKYRLAKTIRDTAWDNTSAEVFRSMHAKKTGTPTMGGILIWITTLVLTLLFNLSRSQTWLPLFVLVMSGILGLADDLMNIRGINRVKGLNVKTKFILQFIIASLAAWWFVGKLEYNTLTVPLLSLFQMDTHLFLNPFVYATLFILVTVFISNAVNITDGLDGLAGGVLASSFAAYSIFAFVSGDYGLAAFCATLLGSLLAFLWFNIYPARFFMGDTGALALGSTLAVVAMLTDSLFVLPIIGIIFVVEACSSLLQRAAKIFWHRKILLSAPLHHHLEAIGWPETKITMRFWIVSAVAAAFGVAVNLVGR